MAEKEMRNFALRDEAGNEIGIFTGEGVEIDKSKSAPSWMPDKIWKPKVKKVGMEHLETLEPPVEKVVVVKRRK